ncbi:MAG: 50S ribosomal protein L23 [Methanonatronarchaeales archaeon]|nr:50S ribosomal protein L23 [Methanonatronarchaeales archaeon]
MIIRRPVLTEKSTDLLDDNTMTFIVNVDATKGDVARTVEDVYGLEVDSVNTMITSRGEKKAMVRFEVEGEAENLATRLGIF